LNPEFIGEMLDEYVVKNVVGETRESMDECKKINESLLDMLL
jgi:hypothetical protein